MINVKHIAKLARLGITEHEEEKFKKELSSVLDYAGQLNEVETQGVEPLTGGTDLVNVFREDEVKHETAESRDARVQEAKKLLDAAPDVKEGYVKVKAIL